jgi:hypothetical protein
MWEELRDAVSKQVDENLDQLLTDKWYVCNIENKFNVHGSMHRNNILVYNSNKIPGNFSVD